MVAFPRLRRLAGASCAALALGWGSPATADDAKPARKDPQFVVAGGPTIGPHAFGNEQCDLDMARCNRGGRFLALGGTVEARARLHKFLYAHVRVLAAGNAVRDKPLYAGMVAPGFGVGVYGRLAFLRAEYLFVIPLGDETFEAPLSSDPAGRATWSNSAAMLSGGLRYRMHKKMVGEAWAGLTVGPREVRELFEETERRTLVSFMVGLQLAFDVLD